LRQWEQIGSIGLKEENMNCEAWAWDRGLCRG
jgi:hypothetical protein